MVRFDVDDEEGEPADEAEPEPVGFEVQGRNLVIRNTDGRVQVQNVPKGFSPETFRHVLAAVEVAYHSMGYYPTPKQAQPFFPDVPLATYGRAMATAEFQMAMGKRGIQIDREDGLTEQQAFALTVLSDFTDRRNTSRRLADVGVPMAQFRAWMRQPLFSRLYHERAEQNVADVVPVALNNLVSNIDNGDQRAIEFGLKMTGRYDPQSIEVANARAVVTTIVELVMQYADEDAQRKILAGVEAKMTSLSIMSAVTKGD
jgi:hypothetical protein